MPRRCSAHRLPEVVTLQGCAERSVGLRGPRQTQARVPGASCLLPPAPTSRSGVGSPGMIGPFRFLDVWAAHSPTVAVGRRADPDARRPTGDASLGGAGPRSPVRFTAKAASKSPRSDLSSARLLGMSTFGGRLSKVPPVSRHGSACPTHSSLRAPRHLPHPRLVRQAHSRNFTSPLSVYA